MRALQVLVVAAVGVRDERGEVARGLLHAPGVYFGAVYDSRVAHPRLLARVQYYRLP